MGRAQASLGNSIAPQVYLTDPDHSILFKHIPFQSFTERPDTISSIIRLNEQKSYQSMEGFGFALTGGSADLLYRMTESKRSFLLKEIFSRDKNGIGVNYIRISIGASNLSSHVFSYDDLSKGTKDLNLSHFDLSEDKKTLIPILKEILTINPKIKILASPWSAPSWMKSNDTSIGGHLLKEYYSVYSRYLIRYLREMNENGIRIESITLQNEPLNPNNNPSMVMTAKEQEEFIVYYFGPELFRSKLKTKLWIYDHNADRPDYPNYILGNLSARKYVSGSAFHLYAGKVEALSKVHDANPDKDIYFTEQWVGAPGNMLEDIKFHTEQLLIGALRNWSKTVIEWNLASDPNQNPHTPGGCDRCLGALTINADSIIRNPAYYIIAQASKCILPGAIRIESSNSQTLPNIALKNPDGTRVVLVINTGKKENLLRVVSGNQTFSYSLNPGAVATFLF